MISVRDVTEANSIASKETSSKVWAVYDRVLGILMEHDPIDIADLPDEYEPEVGTILPRLRKARSELEVRRIVHEEFAKWFSPSIAGPESNFSAIAAAIWRVWQSGRHQN